MKNGLAKRFAILTVMIAVMLCLPLCGLAAEYTAGTTTVFQFSQNSDVMIGLMGEGLDDYAGMREFKRDWDGDGTITPEECNANVTIEWTTEAGTITPTGGFCTSVWPDGTVMIGNPEAWISGLQAEDNGKTATMKMTNSNGDTFTALFRLNYSGWIHNTPVVTSSDAEYEFVRTEKNHYKLVVADGANVSVDITDCIDTDFVNVRDVHRKIYQINPSTGEQTVIAEDSFLDNTFSDANGESVYDDEIRFVFSAENPMNYRCTFSLIFQDTMIGGNSIWIDVEERPTDISAVHTFYFNQNSEVSLALAGEAVDAYEGMSEFKRDWDGDGTITADECNDNVTIEWTTEAGTVTSTSGFFTSVWPDGTVMIGNPEAWISGLQAEDDGKTATMKLTNTNGDTFTALFRLEYSGWIHNTPVVTTDDAEYEFVRTEKNHYKLVVADGASVSVDITDCIDADFANVRDVHRKIYQIDPSTGEEIVIAEDSFLDNTFSDANDESVYDDEIRFVVSAENPMNYNCYFMLVLQEPMVSFNSIWIDVEIRPTDMSANHTFYFNQNGEMSVALLGEAVEDYDGMSEFKRDWDGDGTITADECNENVTIEWSTTTGGNIASTSGFYTNVWYNGTVVIGNPTAWISGLQPEDDGKTVTMTMTNPNGDVFTGTFILKYSGWIHNTPVITTDDEDYEFAYTGEGHYKLTAADGANVSVDFTDCIDTNTDLVQSLTRTISEIDPATGTATVITKDSFDAGEFADENAAGSEDDELSFTVSSDTPKNYRCNYSVVVTENMMFANSTIVLDVEVRTEPLESNIPIYLMTSDNAQEIRCNGLMGLDNALTEEKEAWEEIYSQAGTGEATVTWHSENAALDSLIQEHANPNDPTYLRIRDEEMGLDAFLNETFTATYSKDGETLGVMYFHIQNETIEMLTWHDPTITPQASPVTGSTYDGVYAIRAEVGETVTIKMNYTYSGDINYLWRVDGMQQDNTTDTYSFTAALEHDGMTIVNNAGRSDYDSSISNAKYEYTCKFFIEVTEPAGPLTANATVKMGESEIEKYMHITANNAMRDPSLTMEQKVAWSDVLKQTGITYSWTSENSDIQSIIDKIVVQPDQNALIVMSEDGDLSCFLGNTLSCAVLADGEVLAVANFYVDPVTVEIPAFRDPTTVPDFEFNEEGAPIITVVEGETVTIQSNVTYSKALSYTWYINRELIEYSESSYSFTATMDDNGKEIRIATRSEEFNEELGYGRSSVWSFIINVLPKEPEPMILTLTPKGGELGWMPNQNTKYMYEGETIPFVAEASYEGETVELTYAWYLETRDAEGNVTESVALDCTESTYNLTASMDHSQKYLTCYAEGEGLVPASSSVKLSVTYRIVGDITLNVESSHPVVDDVLTATEGETITIAANPTSPLEDAQYVYFWFLEEHDENGETIAEEKLDCNGDTLTLPASETLNGKYIYCSVGADRLNPASFTCQLVIEPEETMLTANLTVSMGESETNKLLSAYALSATGDPSFTEEERTVWRELLYQSGNTYNWTSEDSAVQSIIDGLNMQPTQDYLMISGAHGDVSCFLGKTFTCAILSDGEQVALVNFHVDAETHEMPTWNMDTTTPAYVPTGNGLEIKAAEGETVTIQMNHTYSQPLIYSWYINDEQIDHAESSYSFTVTSADDGAEISYEATTGYLEVANTAYIFTSSYTIRVVEDEPLVADVTVKMGESETDKTLSIFAWDAKDDPSYSIEDRSAWDNVLNQSGITYSWTSEDSYTQSIIDKLNLQPDSNMLMTVTEDGDLSLLLGKTIVLTIMADGEQIAQANFYVSTETYEMPTWKDPTTTPAYTEDEDGKREIAVVEGNTVSIQMNHTYSKPLIYRWFINEEEIEHPENTYTFTATLEDDGTTIRNVSSSGLIEEVNKSHGSSMPFVIRVIAKDAFKLEQSMLEMTEGKTSTLKVAHTPYEDAEVLWESSDPDVAQVDQKGQVKAVAVGAATITASCNGSLSDSCQVIVHSSQKMTLPAGAAAIAASAFEGIDATEVVVPEDVRSIGSRAFANNSQLKLVTIPGIDTEIAEDAFADCPNITLLCCENSAAMAYAQEKGISFILLGE